MQTLNFNLSVEVSNLEREEYIKQFRTDVECALFRTIRNLSDELGVNISGIASISDIEDNNEDDGIEDCDCCDCDDSDNCKNIEFGEKAELDAILFLKAVDAVLELLKQCEDKHDEK